VLSNPYDTVIGISTGRKSQKEMIAQWYSSWAWNCQRLWSM